LHYATRGLHAIGQVATRLDSDLVDVRHGEISARLKLDVVERPNDPVPLDVQFERVIAQAYRLLRKGFRLPVRPVNVEVHIPAVENDFRPAEDQSAVDVAEVPQVYAEFRLCNGQVPQVRRLDDHRITGADILENGLISGNGNVAAGFGPIGSDLRSVIVNACHVRPVEAIEKGNHWYLP